MFKSIIRRWREWRWRKLSVRFNDFPGPTHVEYFPEYSATMYIKDTATLTYEHATGKGQLKVKVIGE